ncbi:Putative adhesin [Paenibacillaceae bacterium GAS479]|nr:Putative adhesin [Paenibacillaceae bacterium GAS479]
MGMRNLVLLGIILVVVGIAGAGYIFGNSDRSEFLNFGTVKIDQKEEVDSAGITGLKLDAPSLDIDIYKGSNPDRITASLTGRASKKFSDDIQLKLTRSGGVVTVEGIEDSGFSFGFNIIDVSLKIELPQRQFDSISAEIGSGDIVMDSIETGDLKIQIGSGDIELSRVLAKQANIESGSGNIEIDNSRTDNLKTQLSSGDIELSQVEGSMTLATASGDINAELQELTQPFSASTFSGDISVLTDKAPESATVQYSVLSGDFRNGWSGEEETDGGGEQTIKFGAGEVPVNLSTTSGDISLKGK